MHLDEKDEPVWVDGDAVKIRFVRMKKANDDGMLLSDVYTYVRKGGYWPGESGFWSDHEDGEMTVAWKAGRLAVMEMVAAPMPDDEKGVGDIIYPIEPGVTGVWVAYNDFGPEGYRNVAMFNDELEARRYADRDGNSATGMVVGYTGWGQVL